MARRVLTPKEEKWLRENYATTSLHDCGLKLKMSDYAVRCWAQRLGIAVGYKVRIAHQHNQVKVQKPKEEQKPKAVTHDYCLDCRHYQMGGFCAKSQRTTGALHNKPCFEK